MMREINTVRAHRFGKTGAKVMLVADVRRVKTSAQPLLPARQPVWIYRAAKTGWYAGRCGFAR